MKILNPIFFREIHILPRQRYFYRKRVVIVSFLFPLLFSQLLHSYSHAQGLRIFSFYANFSLVTLVFLSILVTLSSIVKEKQGKTLSLLLLTSMSPWQIVGGKFASALFFISLIYAAFLPLGILSISLGGISVLQVFAITTVIISSVAFSISLSLLLGTLFSHDNSYTIVVIILSLLTYDQALYYGLPQFSVSSAIQACLSKGLVNYCYYSFLLQTVLTLLFLTFSSIYLTSYETNQEKFFFSKRSKKFYFSFFSRKKPFLLSARNPIYWRDYRRIKMVYKFWFFSYIVFFCCGLLLQKSLQTIFSFWIAWIGVLLLLNLYQCLNAFLREKQSTTWDLLLLTNLSAKEIYWGKVKAIFKPNLPFFGLSLLLYFYAVENSDRLRESFFISCFTLGTLLIFLWIVYTAALYASLTKENLVKAFGWLLLSCSGVFIMTTMIFNISLSVLKTLPPLVGILFVVPSFGLVNFVWVIFVGFTQDKISYYVQAQE